MKLKRLSSILVLMCICLSVFCGCSDKAEKARAEKLSTVVMTVGNKDINAIEFQIIYGMTVNSVMSSDLIPQQNKPNPSKPFNEQKCVVEGYENKMWDEYFNDITVSTCEEVYSVVAEAEKAGLKVDDKAVEQQMSYTKYTVQSAIMQGQVKSFEEYVQFMCGKDVTEEDLKNYFEMMNLYSAYEKKFKEDNKFSREELDAHYKEIATQLDCYTLRIAAFSTKMELEGQYKKNTPLENAKIFAEKYTSSEEDFQKGYVEDFCAPEVLVTMGSSDFTLSYSVLLNQFDYCDKNYSKWVSSPDRQKGDIYIVDGGKNEAFVIYFIEKNTHDYNVANFYEMLISNEADEKAIKEEWLKTDKSKEAFIAFSKKYNVDTSAPNPEGYFTDVYKGFAFTEVSKWLFDEERKPGDWTILNTKSGVCYLYFDSYGENYRDMLVSKSLFSERFTEKINELKKAAGSKTTDALKDVYSAFIPEK